MTTIEQLYVKLGADGFAKLIAARLRDPMPHREILESVARLLDPRPDDDLALVVVRRTAGNTKTKWIKRREDIDIAWEVLDFEEKYIEGGNPKRGSRKKAVGEIADKRGTSESRIRHALKVLSLIPK